MKNQEFTSKNTSINSRNLPTAFRKFKPAPDEHILDYGCGKFWTNTEDYVIERCGCSLYLPFDKFNVSPYYNESSLEFAEKYGVDRVYCCNVLNVIKEDEIVQYVVDECLSALRSGGMAVFQIYSGNNSGVGSPTKNDCYQRNSKATDYKKFFEKYSVLKGWFVHFGSVFITVNKDIPF